MTLDVRVGAEPIDLPGGQVGALLCHGFTGSTASMRPWAEHLAAAGLTVMGPRLPGHGTTWQDMNTTRWDDWYGELDRTLDTLRSRCDTVFAMGLSMGGTLTLRLAELRPDDLAGLVVVNPALATARKDTKLLPFLKLVLPSFPGLSNDIKKEGVDELAYTRVGLKAAHSMIQQLPVVRADLARITAPVLAFQSRTDHVVEAISATALVDGLTAAGRPVDLRILEDSYHVATLDNDAPEIFRASLEFVHAHAPAAGS